MEIKSVRCLCFSPTGTTKKIAESITQGIRPEFIEMIDITKRAQRNGPPLLGEDDIVILATPVYYGRVPEEILPYLTLLKATHTPVVLVAVYGNRAFEDALKELYDIAVEAEFIPVAGGAFVAEHSYSSKNYPIAQNRPDESDIRKAQEFGAAIRKKLQKVESSGHLTAITIPGQSPYIEPVNLNMIKEARSVVALTPETDTSKCTQCGQCAEVCPTGAISPDDVTQTDRWQCLICFACVKICPEEARQMNEPNFQSAIQALQQNCQDRKEPEIFF
ncbi:EFR1 family ferrodoxin [uncultured Desulfosarcina sp.]|uniref:EFR1 family ferrodoxin n=1 Tax=uncultured Desulfosarcina sp. TaxID=218289 RepID=UPI0029C72D7B|nr:EFR1 family ferrodoxin [uncultured Desulfosarcina sp.]